MDENRCIVCGHLFKDQPEDSFDKLLMEKELTIVDFWAEWCGPCKMLMPIMDKITELYIERVTVVKLNVDTDSKIAEKFSIISLPTILIFKKGKLIHTLVGFKPLSALKKIIAEELK